MASWFHPLQSSAGPSSSSRRPWWCINGVHTTKTQTGQRVPHNVSNITSRRWSEKNIQNLLWNTDFNVIVRSTCTGPSLLFCTFARDNLRIGRWSWANWRQMMRKTTRTPRRARILGTAGTLVMRRSGNPSLQVQASSPSTRSVGVQVNFIRFYDSVVSNTHNILRWSSNREGQEDQIVNTVSWKCYGGMFFFLSSIFFFNCRTLYTYIVNIHVYTRMCACMLELKEDIPSSIHT